MTTAKICPYGNCRKEINKLRPGKLCPHCRQAVVGVEGGYITWADSLVSEHLLKEFEKMVSSERKVVFYFPKGVARAKELKIASSLIMKVREFLDKQSETQVKVNDFACEFIRTFFMTKSRDYRVTSLAQVQKSFIDIAERVYQFLRKNLAVERNKSPYKDNPPIFDNVLRL